MIGIDTTIIVRYLMQDDAVMSARATHVLEDILSEDVPGFVSVVAVAEIVWVLRSTYRIGKEKIASAIELLLESKTLVIEREREVFLAWSALKDGTGDFADALIGALGTRAGCTHTLTFDRKASRLPGFQVA